MTLLFSPHPEAQYLHPYLSIVEEINSAVDSGNQDLFLSLMRKWSREDLFFLLYFILRVNVNHPWLVERIKDVQTLNDKTVDLWPREHYKALSCDTPILTSKGWKSHGDLVPGDMIFDADGELTEVIANTGPIECSECSVVVTDMGELLASNQHEWLIRKKRRTRISGTNQRITSYEDQIVETSALPVRDWNYRLPRTPILRFSYRPLPIDPYVLGVWLGDGTTANGNITCNDIEIMEYVRLAGYGSDLKDLLGNGCTWSTYGLYRDLRLSSLLNNKHIPEEYFSSSPGQRLSLLQGLMDTDGHCNDRGTAYFVNTNLELVWGVYYLAASLGMKPHVNQYPSQNTGEYKETWGVTFQAYKGLPPFRLSRKFNRCKSGNRVNNGIYLKNIVPVEGTKTVNCIQVKSLDGVYLAGKGLIPTHNSTIITYGLNVQTILKNPEVRICIFSHTRAIAKAFLHRIKTTFESNAVLKGIFPDILWETPSSESPRWSLDEGIVVRREGIYHEMTVEAWGLTDGQPTAKHFDVLNYDDIVTRDSVTTPEQIRKTDECFRMSGKLGASDLLAGTEGTRRVIGTRYHYNDQYSQLEKNPDWTIRKHPVQDENGDYIFFTPEQADAKRRADGSYVWATQMMLDPRKAGKQSFMLDWLQYYKELPDILNLYLLVDPANEKKTSRTGSDYTCMWLWGLDGFGNFFWVHGVRERLNLTETWEKLVEVCKKFPRILKIGYERYGMQRDLGYYEQRAGETGTYLPYMEPLGGLMKKEDRVLRMIPMFEHKKVYIPYHMMNEAGEDLVRIFIDEEYLFFPYSTHDDLMDAASRIHDIEMAASRPWFPEVESGGGSEVADLGWYRLKKGSRFANL